MSLITSYLQNRKIQGKISDELSVSKVVGVPQGSCLGPLLYLVYANDLGHITKGLTSVIFADDTTIIEKCNSIEALSFRLNILLSKILDWTNYNKLSLNKAKTKWMLFTNKRIGIPKLFLGGEEVEKVEIFKYLLDSKLKHSEHLNYLKSKLFSLRFVTYKIKSFLTARSARQFYFAMVESVLSFGILIYGGTHLLNAPFKKLCRLQDKIILNLFATHDEHGDNLNNLYKRNNILKLTDLYKYRVCITLFKVFHQDYAPFILVQLLNLQNEQKYNVRNHNTFSVPFPRVINTIKVNFIYNAVKVWNELSPDIRSITSFQKLKKSSKVSVLK